MLFVSTATVAIISSAIGCGTGIVLWDAVAKALQKYTESTVLLNIEPWMLAVITVVQLAFLLVVDLGASLAVVYASRNGRR